jgi:hypothetical protein
MQKKQVYLSPKASLRLGGICEFVRSGGRSLCVMLLSLDGVVLPDGLTAGPSGAISHSEHCSEASAVLATN